MDEYADIYYVDARNAVNDHRRPQGGGGFFRQPPAQPSRTVVVAPPGARLPGYATAPQVVYPQPVAQVTYAQPGALSSLFQRLTTGEIVEMVVQAFVAMQPLPAAPVATDRVSDNVENLITYNSALASYAKRDEQLRTIGSIVAKLV